MYLLNGKDHTPAINGYIMMSSDAGVTWSFILQRNIERYESEFKAGQYAKVTLLLVNGSSITIDQASLENLPSFQTLVAADHQSFLEYLAEDTTANEKADVNNTFNNQTGTSYTLALTDNGKIVGLNNAAAITLTVPPDSTTDFPIGAEITIVQDGAGQVTVAPGSGVTINSAGGLLSLASQHSAATLIKRSANTWLLIGDLA